MQRVRPEKIGCGAASVLVGAAGLAFMAGMVISGMTALAWVVLMGSNLLLWIGLLVFVQGQKEDLEDAIRGLSEAIRQQGPRAEPKANTAEPGAASGAV
jgi:hypothetical protein